MLRFAGFELNRLRAELRGPDGVLIKLRPKTLVMLELFASNAGRVLTKQELLDAVWPNVHVGDDSLFQCIREIRTALGDDQRQMIKLVSGRGYLFDAEVSVEPATAGESTPAPNQAPGTAPPEPLWQRLSRRSRLAYGVIGVCIVALGATLVTGLRPNLVAGAAGPTIAVMPIAAAGAEATVMAANVTRRLVDGLAKIDNVRVEAVTMERSRTISADFLVTAELHKNGQSWDVNARMTRASTGNVEWTGPVSVAADSELSLQQSRLAAGIGHPLALRINTLIDAAQRPALGHVVSPASRTRVAIEQAAASIMQTTRARFANAQTILEKALADDPDNVDLAVGLAALQLRGVQMVWYTPEESAAAEESAKATLERALRIKPSSIPVLEAYCRFLGATNQFVESLVTCSRALNLDPWNGMAIYHIGLAQVQLGRFDDALASFKLADSYDTPRVSRWTWQLGVGMTYLLMGRSKEALPWLQRSIAITPASGRSYMLLSAAYEGLGQKAEARAAMEKALALRPGSNAGNIALPTKNASRTFLEASEWIKRANIAAGLPEN
jgi:DNA-binding winged helix-turn-helix (wHTH) protein/tetratricopeptide (TPR) repeat protein